MTASALTRLLVPPSLAGERLDRFLPAVTTLSRRRSRDLVAAGEVWRNGQPLRVQSRQLAAGDVIDVLRPAVELGVPPRPELEPVEVLHEDRSLLFANKPAGVLSQPAERRREGETALDERLLLQLALAAGRPPFLRLVHRLDRGTSGVLLFATDPRALPPLSSAWREGRVQRRYLAVVSGCPPAEEEVEQPIARVEGAWRFEVEPGGKPARTRIRRLNEGDGWSLVECQLETGRTHQVRVHLAHLGYPVLGDRLYGGPPGDRPLLHAAELTLPHPRTGKALTVTAPPPQDLTPYLTVPV
ncbi:MAG: RluA family pseudouridine synthase [Acidobacteria bacterium]|nr:RluA family pseudouridine synthase [Acidobacteriota bacterium]